MNKPKINILCYYANVKDITEGDKIMALHNLKNITGVYDSIIANAEGFIGDIHRIGELRLINELNTWMSEDYEKLILELLINIRLYVLYVYNNSLHISEVKLNEDNDTPVIYNDIEVTREMMMFMIKMAI